MYDNPIQLFSKNSNRLKRAQLYQMEESRFLDMGIFLDTPQNIFSAIQQPRQALTLQQQVEQADMISFTDPAFSMISQYASYIIHSFKNEGKSASPQAVQNRSREKERLNGRMANFNPKDNFVWRKITDRFGANIKQPELLNIAKVLADKAHISLDRDAKRRKSVLIKWFEENWLTIEPYLQIVVLEDSK